MLTITVSGVEAFDESKQQFVVQGGFRLELEHSLVSLSKWESKYEKPFLGKEEKTGEEVVDYIKAMTLTPNVPGEVFEKLSEDNFKTVSEYIDSKQSATWFSDPPGAAKGPREIVTSELIYYWMTVFQIPFECETWHLNRLFTLIRICNVKQGKQKKMSRSEIAARNRQLNAQRKQQLGTTG